MPYGIRIRIKKTCPICSKEYTIAHWEIKQNRTCSHECSKEYKRRLPISIETRKKLSLLKKGKYKKQESSQWKDNKASYASIHEWVRKNYDIPLDCEECHEVSPLDAANISGLYIRERYDWRFLCRKCHHKFDGKDSNFYRRIGYLSKNK
jgi:hypothetical protein